MEQSRAQTTGFTLIELIVTLTVVAIIAALAAPSFASIIRTQRLVTQANDLVATLQLARTEAVKRGVQVTIRHTGSTANNWDNGWTVFTDWDGDGVYDDDGSSPSCDTEEDCLLRSDAALKGSMTLRTNGNYTQWMAYLPSGYPVDSTATENSGSFSLCADNGDTGDAKQIVVSTTGRPSVEEGTSSCP